MRKWEYKEVSNILLDNSSTTNIYIDDEQYIGYKTVIGLFNELGQDGWELTGTEQYDINNADIYDGNINNAIVLKYYFKREIQ